jgi:DNA recombination protein RmuC
MTPSELLLLVAALCMGAALGWLAAARRAEAAVRAALARESELREALAAERAGVIDARGAQERADRDAVLELLRDYSGRLGVLEQQRQRESAVLSHAVEELRRSNEEVRTEARRLSSALSDHAVRGTWGEVQLRRVLELSGMLRHVDFHEQVGATGEGSARRPDAVVHLPNDRRVVIDAKVPLDAYLRGMNAAEPGERAECFAQHAAAVDQHVRALSRRAYAERVPGSVDFVVLFLPGDPFLAAALDARPELFEQAARHDVVLATPGTLLAFLRGVASGWGERRVTEEAMQVAELGRELHERLCIFSEHLASMGSALTKAVGAYNSAVGSFERRLLVASRRLESHGAASRRAVAPGSRVEAPSVAAMGPQITAREGSGTASEVSTSTST